MGIEYLGPVLPDEFLDQLAKTGTAAIGLKDSDVRPFFVDKDPDKDQIPLQLTKIDAILKSAVLKNEGIKACGERAVTISGRFEILQLISSLNLPKNRNALPL